MTFFEHGVKRGFETRFAEVILGMVALGYGWHALHISYLPGKIASQFQILLMIEGSAFELGVALCVAGIAALLFSFSRFRWARFVANAALSFLWLCIIMLFLFYKEPGIPLLNGMIFAVASAVVNCTILFHEKHSTNCSAS